jgi:GTPase involved in cell partitioning and DNA repair
LAYERIFGNDKPVERKGFIMVCDATDIKSVLDLGVVIDKLTQIEKTNNLVYPKCILLNKIDKFQQDKTQLTSIITELNRLKTKYRIKFYKVSALTGKSLLSSLREYLNLIYQLENESKNEGFDENEDQEEDDENKIDCTDKLNSCSRKIFCGSTMFTCGVIYFKIECRSELRRRG